MIMVPAEIELQEVREELYATKKKLGRYTELVASLYDELDSLRTTVSRCDNCKKQAAAAAFGGCLSPSPAPAPLSQHIPGSAQRRSDQPVQLPAMSESDKSPQSIDTASKAKSLPVLPTAATHIIRPSAIRPLNQSKPTPTNFPPPAKLPTPVDNSIPDWKVVHNPNIPQTLKLYQTDTFRNDDLVVWDVKFSRNGNYLALALSGGETHIYDLKTRSKIVLAEHNVKDNKPWVATLRFSPDDVYLATGLSDGQIKIWDVSHKRMRVMFKGHTGPVLSVDFSPYGRFLVSASGDHTVRLWRTRDGSSKQLSNFATTFNSVAFSPRGRFVFSGNDDHRLRIWNTRNDKLVADWKGHAGVVWCVTPSKDGKGLLSGGDDRILKYWDVSPYTDLESGSASLVVNSGQRKESLKFEGHTYDISSISLSPDERWIFSTSGGDGSMRIWDAKTAAWQCTLKGHKRAILAADVSPTGQLLASASMDGCVRLWKISAEDSVGNSEVKSLIRRFE